MKAVAVIAIFAVLGTGASLHCFECNTELDASCRDPFIPSSTAVKNAFLVTCPNNQTGMAPFCRKSKIYFKQYEVTRLYRECGYERREEYDCYQKRAEDYVMDVCQCDTDSCNAAGRFVPMSTASGALVTAVVAAALARV